jgi:hypothetical protein
LIVLSAKAADLKNAYPSRWPQAVVAAIDRDYKLVDVFNCTDAAFIYEPNPDVGLAAANGNAEATIPDPAAISKNAQLIKTPGAGRATAR